MMIETIAGIFIGFGLAASTGFRIFLPLLALSVAGYFHLVPLGVQWAWVSSSQAIIILVIATVAETLAYYIPWLDNLLDTIALPLASIAGTLVMASTMVDLDPAWQWALAIIAGGGTAGIIKGVNAKTRLASTATTAGIANPIITTTETAFSAILSALSIFLWPIAAILVILLLVSIFFFYKKLRKYWRKLFQRNSPATTERS